MIYFFSLWFIFFFCFYLFIYLSFSLVFMDFVCYKLWHYSNYWNFHTITRGTINSSENHPETFWHDGPGDHSLFCHFLLFSLEVLVILHDQELLFQERIWSGEEIRGPAHRERAGDAGVSWTSTKVWSVAWSMERWKPLQE